MKKTFSKLGVMALAAAALAFVAPAVSAQSNFEFHGYARSGIMFANGLNAPGSQLDENWVGRLGNEAGNNYAESEFVNKNVAEDGSWSKYHIMMAYSNDQSYASWSTLTPALRQIYAEMGGFAWDPKAVYWVGQKYNGRDDVHILDQFWRNYSGQGIGMINGFGGKVDLSFVANGINSNANTDGYKGVQTTTDLRVRVIDNLELEAALTYVPFNTDVNAGKTNTGYNLAAVYSFDKFFYVANGYSRAVLQVSGGLSGYTWALGQVYTNTGAETSALALRALVFGEASDILPNLDVMPMVKYEYENTGVSGKDPEGKFGIAARPVYKINKNISLQVEGAYARVFVNKDKTAGVLGSDNGGEYKFTVAPTLALDSGFWGRPQLRLFYTYVNRDKELGSYITANGKDAGESRFGVQMETWF